jgi:hypothetical protein
MVALIKPYPSYDFPRHSHHLKFSMQIVLGLKLGAGEFSNVFEVRSFVLRPNEDDTFKQLNRYKGSGGNKKLPPRRILQ